MWKQVAEFPIWKWFFFFSHVKDEKKGCNGPALFFYYPVYKMLLAGCTTIPLETELWWGTGQAFQRPAPLQTASCCLAALFSGKRVGCFSFGLSSSWPPNWKYLGSWQQRLTCLFHMNHETGGCLICLMVEGHGLSMRRGSSLAGCWRALGTAE